MGDHADDAMHQELLDDLQNSKPTGKPRWRTKTGEVLLVEDMTDEHLVNAIKWLTRRWVVADLMTWRPLARSMDILLSEVDRRQLHAEPTEDAVPSKKAYVIMTADYPHEVCFDEETAKRRVAELAGETIQGGDLKYKWVHYREVPMTQDEDQDT